MNSQKYAVNHYLIGGLLSAVKSSEIAIPEIQRPFVWEATKVRDLMDSLYQGFPVGYVIVWKNPNIKLKDGSISYGKKILIDGQQRITALTAAILGEYVVNKEYERIKIKIAFNPILEKFEVQNTAILKDKTWIPDISVIMNGSSGLLKQVSQYQTANPEVNEDQIEKAFTNLTNIIQKQIGLIELNDTLDIETVTEIFIRINSQGVVLSQADFVMSKIAANETYGGNTLRKAVDYFCHLATAPHFYQFIQDHDKSFASTELFRKMAWLKDEQDDIYDPAYNDMLRVSFTSEFDRGKLSDLVSLLSGRNFETRTFEESIAEESFNRLTKGVYNFINETNFKTFVMIIRSAGFISADLIRGQNPLNFSYILFLKLRSQGEHPAKIEKLIRRWFVLSLLTQRYSGSAESLFDSDIKQLTNKSVEQFLIENEQAQLSDAFWNNGLTQSLATTSTASPFFTVFLAAQVKNKDQGFLSQDVTVADLITIKGDIHHVFPRDYLKSKNLSKSDYNQVANYVYMQTNVNIQIGNKPPKEYLSRVKEQINNKAFIFGSIMDEDQLAENLRMNCIPTNIFSIDFSAYPEFLIERRKLMAEKIKNYYNSL